MTRFHIRSWQAVRDADVRGVWSPSRQHTEEAVALARELRVGDARAFGSIEDMVADPAIDCIWICGPNFARIDNMERIVEAMARGARLVGIACEKPLARNAAEAARMVELVERTGALHGYLENQLFTPSVERGKAIGHPLIVEATTSWSFVGAGLRLTMELLGPEYSMSISTLDSGTKVFFSRRLNGHSGEDLVEKQNAEQGLMPVLGNESAEYGYEGENRYFTSAFAQGLQPEPGFHAGRDVTELLMACYMSAEQERVIEWKPEGLASYQPPVARRPAVGAGPVLARTTSS